MEAVWTTRSTTVLWSRTSNNTSTTLLSQRTAVERNWDHSKCLVLQIIGWVHLRWTFIVLFEITLLDPNVTQGHENDMEINMQGTFMTKSYKICYKIELCGPFQKEILHPLQPAEFSTLVHFQHPPAQEWGKLFHKHSSPSDQNFL